jgi:EmrB/QacA subfamily drug resistance transporter
VGGQATILRKYFVFGAVGLVLLLGSLNITSISVAFPDMLEDFNTSLVIAGWVLTIFGLVQVALMPVAGKLSERFGHRRAFLAFTIAFTAGSLLCAIAPDITSLILFRVIQAIGGAGFLPCAAGIVADTFPRSRQRAIGFFSSIFPIGAITGPNVGAWLVSTWDWRANFWFTAAVSLVCVIVCFIILRESSRQPSTARTPLDWQGTLFFAGALFALMLAVTQASQGGGTGGWLLAGLELTLAGVLGWLFVRNERRAEDPVIPLSLITRQPFLVTNIYNLFFGVCSFGIFTLVPLYAQTLYGASVWETGIIVTPRFIAMMVVSTAASYTLPWSGYRKPILAGTLLVAACLFLLAFHFPGIRLGSLEIGPAVWLGVVLFISGAGSGLATPAANNACIELMPDRISTITGLRGTFRQLGTTFGITLSTVVIQLIRDPSQAYFVTFLVWAIVLLATTPLVFLMPEVNRTKKSS